MKATTQIERDIAFCIDELNLANEQIGELYALDRYHDDNYLKPIWRLD